MNNPQSSLLKVLAVACAIPTIGLIISLSIITDLNSDLQAEGLPNITVLCEAVRAEGLGDASIKRTCSEVGRIELLRLASIIAGAIGLMVPILYWFGSKYAGENRKRMAAIFPPLLRLSVTVIAVSVLLQGTILTYAIYVGESYWIERIHVFIVLAIGFGALIGGLKLIWAAVSFGGKLRMTAMGKAVKASDAPKLFGFVQSLAEKLHAKAPDNIIVGLDPTFYVTSSDIFDARVG